MCLHALQQRFYVMLPLFAVKDDMPCVINAHSPIDKII